MNINNLSKTLKKLTHNRLVNYILGKRLCRECARYEWAKEDKTQSFTTLLGICESCLKAGEVAYIEK